MLRSAIFLGLLFASGLAVANQQRVAVDSGNFTEQRRQIEADLSTEKYSEISREQRARVRDLLASIGARLDAVPNVDALSEIDKASLFNEQEEVNTILTRAAADSRVVCRHEQTTGTHRRTTNCQTLAERRRRREQSQQAIINSQHAPLQSN
jgi:hypothetical protein